MVFKDIDLFDCQLVTTNNWAAKKLQAIQFVLVFGNSRSIKLHPYCYELYLSSICNFFKLMTVKAPCNETLF